MLFLHSVPTSSDDWVEMLPEVRAGWRSTCPASAAAARAVSSTTRRPPTSDFLERFLRMLELDRVAIVAHGWGAAFALMLAMARPERVSRLAIVDAVPLLEGFAWPRPVRWWRPPVLGELVMGSINPWYLRRTLRRRPAARRPPGPTHASRPSGTSSTRAPSARSCACTAPWMSATWRPPAGASSRCGARC